MELENAGSKQAFDANTISRRLASIQRWVSMLNYVVMYPEADWRSYLLPPDSSSGMTKKETMVAIMDRLEMHTTVLNGIIRDTMPDKDSE